MFASRYIYRVLSPGSSNVTEDFLLADVRPGPGSRFEESSGDQSFDPRVGEWAARLSSALFRPPCLCDGARVLAAWLSVRPPFVVHKAQRRKEKSS